MARRTAKGKAFVNLLPLLEGERVVALQPVREFSEGAFVVMTTRAHQEDLVAGVPEHPLPRAESPSSKPARHETQSLAEPTVTTCRGGRIRTDDILLPNSTDVVAAVRMHSQVAADVIVSDLK
jgi:hypothetical protein